MAQRQHRLGLVVICLALAGCGPSSDAIAHYEQCNIWMNKAQNKSDSLNVEMTCASIAAAKNAEDQARAATAMGAAAAGMAAGSRR